MTKGERKQKDKTAFKVKRKTGWSRAETWGWLPVSPSPRAACW